MVEESNSQNRFHSQASSKLKQFSDTPSIMVELPIGLTYLTMEAVTAGTVPIPLFSAVATPRSVCQIGPVQEGVEEAGCIH